MGKININSFFIPSIIVLISFSFFQFFYPYHLFFTEQIQLFVYTPEYLLSYFHQPACLANLLGDFFTQFYYLRGGGAVVLAITFTIEWILLDLLIKKQIPEKNAGWWAIIPVAVDFILHLSLLHTLNNSISLILLLLFLLLVQLIENKKLSIILIFFLSLTGHWLIGNAIFCLPFFLFFLKGQRKYFLVTASLVLILVVPIFFRAIYLLTFEQLYIFPAFLTKSMFLPATIIVVLFLLKILSLERKSPLKPQKGPSNFGSQRIYLQAALLAILVLGINYNGKFTIEKVLSYDCETYFGNTIKILKKAEKETSKNKFIAYYTNIALAQTGQFPEKLLHYYQPTIYGLILPVSPNKSWQSILFSNEFFYRIGDMNMAQHSAMLANTFSPFCRSARMVKRLAEINMVNNDYSAAEKYLRILQKTLFYQGWAEKRLTEIKENKQANWLTEKQKYISKTDTIRGAQAYLESLQFMVQQNPQNNMALDYLLCYYLLNKDLSSFKKAYDCYLKPQNKPVAKVYAEALLIDFLRNKVPTTTIRDYRIPKKTVTDFAAYTKIFQKDETNLDVLKSNFGTSYWFYYHFATMENSSKNILQNLRKDD